MIRFVITKVLISLTVILGGLSVDICCCWLLISVIRITDWLLIAWICVLIGIRLMLKSIGLILGGIGVVLFHIRV